MSSLGGSATLGVSGAAKIHPNNANTMNRFRTILIQNFFATCFKFSSTYFISRIIRMTEIVSRKKNCCRCGATISRYFSAGIGMNCIVISDHFSFELNAKKRWLIRDHTNAFSERVAHSCVPYTIRVQNGLRMYWKDRLSTDVRQNPVDGGCVQTNCVDMVDIALDNRASIGVIQEWISFGKLENDICFDVHKTMAIINTSERSR